MLSRTFFPTPLRFLLLLSALSASAFGAAKAVKIVYNKDAKAVADKVKPLGLTPKADPNGLKAVGAQVAAVLTELEKLAATNAPGTDTLLKNAYEMFRPDVGPTHRAACIFTIQSMWNEARGLGAFDDKHQYTGKITKGPDAGQDIVIEYIVPIELAPKFSKDLANVRLGGASKTRSGSSSAPTAREISYKKGLDSIAEEQDSMARLAAQTKVVATDAAGETKEQAEKKFKAEMTAEGAATDELPSIRLKGELISMPTKTNGNNWHVQADLTNLSLHATEVELETMVIGSTWKKRENYLMLDKTEKVHLRSGQQVLVPAETAAQTVFKSHDDVYENLDKKLEIPRSKAVYRGTIWKVTHAKGDVAVFATDDALLEMLKKDSPRYVGNMVKMFLDPKEWAKASAASANK
jgi:hypothetical protein